MINNQWTENDSQLYRQIAPVAVPARAEQLATLLALLPFSPTHAFRAVEIGAGEGLLSAALLECFPKATLVALDGSAEMRHQLNQRLQKFRPRGQVEPFELAANSWHTRLDEVDCVLSSLCLHHLSGPEKRALFSAIHERLSAKGTLLIADLVEPQRPEAQLLFASTWDRATQQQSIALTGNTQLFAKFEQAEWNLYRHPDPADKPSPLFEQLLWLNETGFSVVDCFWMQAGHAIYGGYKTSPVPGEVPFETAFSVVQGILGQ